MWVYAPFGHMAPKKGRRQMKDYRRQNPAFSLCGLCCALCPMYLGGYCPGCGGGEGHQPCAVIRCSREHGEMEYCFSCAEFPCERLREAARFDSFLPHRHMLQNLGRARDTGVPAFQAELAKREKILHTLLANYNDGRKKTFFCAAAALLPLAEPGAGNGGALRAGGCVSDAQGKGSLRRPSVYCHSGYAADRPPAA